MQWKQTDPRDEVEHHDSIVIMRPHFSGRGWDPEIGWVYTKESWSIFTSFMNNPIIHADQSWPQDWYWNFTPDRKE
jgi:hypothetical protein